MLLLCLFVLLCCRSSSVHHITLSKFDSSPDGFHTQVLGINNQMMYPIILESRKEAIINVNNQLDEPTTIHFHGIFQNGTNYYDGVAGTTQCPIAPGKSLQYRINPGDQHGTFWYHSHYKAQYAKGIRGPLIIRDPLNEPYINDYDEEYVVMLNEWYHARNPKDLIDPFLSSNNSAGAEPVPESVLINGQGRVDCANVTGTCISNSSFANFAFAPGKSYRLRIINTAAMGSFYFSIDGHDLVVIEADGVDTIKQTVSSIRIAVGQRYSVIVTANQKPANYWMRAYMDTSVWTNFASNILDPMGKAVISYDNVEYDEPISLDSNWKELDPYSILPYVKAPVPDSTTDYRVMFAIVPDEMNQSRAYVQVDGFFDFNSYVMPDDPVLFSVTKDNTALVPSSNQVQLDLFEVVDLTIYNDDAMPHSFHLHGHNFWVIKHGHTINLKTGKPNRWSVSKRTTDDDSMKQYPIRDTIEVPPCVIKDSSAGEGGICGGTKGYVIIRFIADNPGIWLFHCHMEWHMLQGLAVTWVEGADVLKKRGYKSIPESIKSTCKP